MSSTEQPVAPGQNAPVLITRYPNRRLYDRSQARYVTLHEIAEVVRGGKTVTVRDSKTGEDLTRSILTQIILEYHPERMELFPVNVLSAMIRTNEEVLGFLREYFRQSLTYLEVLQRQQAINPLLLPMQWLSTLLPTAPSPQAAAPEPAEPDAAALTRRIAELERRLDTLQGGAATSAGKAAPKRRGPDGAARRR